MTEKREVLSSNYLTASTEPNSALYKVWVIITQNTTAMECWETIRINCATMNAINVRPYLGNCTVVITDCQNCPIRSHLSNCTVVIKTASRCVQCIQYTQNQIKKVYICLLKLGFIYTDCTGATERSLLQECTNLVCQVARETTFCTVLSNSRGSSAWNLLHVTHLAT